MEFHKSFEKTVNSVISSTKLYGRTIPEWIGLFNDNDQVFDSRTQKQQEEIDRLGRKVDSMTSQINLLFSLSRK